MATVEVCEGSVLGSGFTLLMGLAEIHVPRMWVEEDKGHNVSVCVTQSFDYSYCTYHLPLFRRVCLHFIRSLRLTASQRTRLCFYWTSPTL